MRWPRMMKPPCATGLSHVAGCWRRPTSGTVAHDIMQGLDFWWGGRLPNKGAQKFFKKKKKKKKRPRLSPEETQTWRLCFWNLVCRGTLSRSRRDYLAKSQELLECFFFFFFFGLFKYVNELKLKKTRKSQQTATSPTDKLPAFCSCLSSTRTEKLVSERRAKQVDSRVCLQISRCELRRVQVPVCDFSAPSLAVAKGHRDLKRSRDVASEDLCCFHTLAWQQYTWAPGEDARLLFRNTN